jgi:hypothetical protein
VGQGLYVFAFRADPRPSRSSLDLSENLFDWNHNAEVRRELLNEGIAQLVEAAAVHLAAGVGRGGIEFKHEQEDSMEQHQVLASRTRVLNLGFDLRQRLDAVACAEQLDGPALGRRIIKAAVTARADG